MSESDLSAWTPPAFGSPCWYEIPAVDVAASKKFYETLFPTWTWRPGTEKYTADKIAMFSFQEGHSSLGGGITKAESKVEIGKTGGVTIYHHVASIEKTRQLAVSIGAKVLSEVIPEGDLGHYQLFQDLSGNRFGVYEFKG